MNTINSIAANYQKMTASLSYTNSSMSQATNSKENSKSLVETNKTFLNYSFSYESSSFVFEQKSTEAIFEKFDFKAEVVKKDFSFSSIKNMKDYFSPENTAERIVGFARDLFSKYASSIEEQDGSDVVNNFMEQAIAGIEEGFRQAGKILEGVGLMSNSSVTENKDNTYDLVMEKMEALRETLLHDYKSLFETVSQQKENKNNAA